jgi:hypothetical protein
LPQVYSLIRERTAVERTKWLYCTAEILRDRLDDVLNDWGSRGWELVALTVTPLPADYNYRGPDLFLAVFKTPELKLGEE